MTFMMKSRVD